jgi:hypothetical protein
MPVSYSFNVHIRLYTYISNTKSYLNPNAKPNRAARFALFGVAEGPSRLGVRGTPGPWYDYKSHTLKGSSPIVGSQMLIGLTRISSGDLCVRCPSQFKLQYELSSIFELKVKQEITCFVPLANGSPLKLGTGTQPPLRHNGAPLQDSAFLPRLTNSLRAEIHYVSDRVCA